VAGVVAAASSHALDRAGQLPFVHEAADVRTAMSPALVCLWLALAAGLSALAARTRPILVGAPCALIVAGVPELVGRHDLGAVAEPGAIAGALVQWLLIAAIVGLAVLADRQLLRRWLSHVAFDVDVLPPLPLVDLSAISAAVIGVRSRGPPKASMAH
jgi:hypothetical protein